MASKAAHNALTRHTQLDEATAAALDAWQRAHGVRSASAAIRELLQRALAADRGLEVEERVAAARAGALRAARVAVVDALRELEGGGSVEVRARVEAAAKRQP